MGAFFKGWRRKLGVLSLMMACVLSAGWVRSLQGFDQKSFSISNTTAFSLKSWNARLAFQWYESKFPLKVWNGKDDRVVIRTPNPEVCDFSEDNISWTLNACGFGVAHEDRKERSTQYTIWVVPFWSIVTPLTLLSAYLLLSKPRTKHTEPVPQKLA